MEMAKHIEDTIIDATARGNASCPVLSPDRREVLDRIARYEKEGRFDEDVENDPPTIPLDHTKVDYLGEKFSSKIKTAIANAVGYRFFNAQIKKGLLVTENVVGTEHLAALQNGAILTCNHFAPYDNFIVYHAIRRALPRKRLYKIVREGNYTSFPGLYGFLFRNCNTLPLASDVHGSMALMKAVDTLLRRGESVLIYPEKAMWWNYRKPRPYQSGGFKMAQKAGVPVLPLFVTMRDGDEFAPDGSRVQYHTLHILPPVFPRKEMAQKAGADRMREEAFAAVVKTYESVYGEPYAL